MHIPPVISRRSSPAGSPVRRNSGWGSRRDHRRKERCADQPACGVRPGPGRRGPANA